MKGPALYFAFLSCTRTGASIGSAIGGVMHDSGKVLLRGALVDAVIEGSFRAKDPVTLLWFRGDRFRFVVGFGTR